MKLSNFLTEVKITPKKTGASFKKASGQIGFEIEGIFKKTIESVDPEVTDDAKIFAERSSLYHNLQQSLVGDYIEDVVVDNSIKDFDEEQFYGAEVITIPIPFDKCLQVLAHLFAELKKYGFHTNTTTGLHVNVSFSDWSTNNPYFNPKGTKIDLLKLVLFMSEQYQLSLFGRLDNLYAKSWAKTIKLYNSEEFENTNLTIKDKIGKDINELDIKTFIHAVNDYMIALNSQSKYFTVNFKKLTAGYLEFRALGGTNYEKKMDYISEMVFNIIYALKLALDPQASRKEYFHKVAILINKLKTDPSTELKTDLCGNCKILISIAKKLKATSESTIGKRILDVIDDNDNATASPQGLDTSLASLIIRKCHGMVNMFDHRELGYLIKLVKFHKRNTNWPQDIQYADELEQQLISAF